MTRWRTAWRCVLFCWWQYATANHSLRCNRTSCYICMVCSRIFTWLFTGPAASWQCCLVCVLDWLQYSLYIIKQCSIRTEQYITTHTRSLFKQHHKDANNSFHTFNDLKPFQQHDTICCKFLKTFQQISLWRYWLQCHFLVSDIYCLWLTNYWLCPVYKYSTRPFSSCSCFWKKITTDIDSTDKYVFQQSADKTLSQVTHFWQMFCTDCINMWIKVCTQNCSWQCYSKSSYWTYHTVTSVFRCHWCVKLKTNKQIN